MSIVLSHRTAQLYHAAPLKPVRRATLPAGPTVLKPEPPDVSLLFRVRQMLLRYGVPEAELKTVDALVPSPACRRAGLGLSSHVWSDPIPAQSLIELNHGIYVSNVAFCAQQVTTLLDELELIEHLFELCGQYGLPLRSEDPYTVRAPLITPHDLQRHVACAPGQRGINRLRRALRYVQGGVRSPMETALVIPIVGPRRLGGLNIKTVQVARRVDVAGRARNLTRRSYFECDALLPKSRTDLEYDGIIHEEAEQAAIDTERANAMAAMGYSVMNVNRFVLFDPAAFRRLMLAIMQREGRRVDRLPREFFCKQEELRRFVLRRWLSA